MSQITNTQTPDDEQELRPTDKARICKWMLKLGGFDYGEPGSFLRSQHLYLDKQIRTADQKAAYERTQRRRKAA